MKTISTKYTIQKYNQHDGVITYLQQRIISSGEVFMFTGNPNAASWWTNDELQRLFELLPYFMDRDLVNEIAHFDYEVVDNHFNEVWMKS